MRSWFRYADGQRVDDRELPITRGVYQPGTKVRTANLC